MPLKIIGAGFGRTGTLSTCTALNALGFPCYHMFEVVGNKRNKTHVDFWQQVANSEPGSQQDWERVFAHYTATVDNPGCCVWRALMEAYPEAKVLLTVHPKGAEGWYESAINTIYATQTQWQFKVLQWLTPFGRKFGDVRRMIWQRFHRGTMDNKAAAIARYHEHIAEVKAAVPAEKLLIFSVDQGWEPLCQFLELPIPDEAFPNVNDRESFQKHLKTVSRGAYVVLGIYGLLAAAMLYAGWYFFR